MKIYNFFIVILIFPQIQCMQWLMQQFYPIIRGITHKKQEPYQDLTDKEKKELIGAPGGSPLTKEQENTLIAIDTEIEKTFEHHNIQERARIVMRAIAEHKVHPNSSYLCRHVNPLMQAIRHNDFEYAQFLLAHGSDPNDLIDCGLYPMPILGFSDNVEMSKLLLKYGADKSFAKYSGRILTEVIGSKKAELIPLYLEHGADPNTYCHQGMPLIMTWSNYELRKETVDVVRFLMQGGAFIHVKSKHSMLLNVTFPQLLLARTNACREQVKKGNDPFKDRLKIYEDMRSCAIEEQKKLKEPRDLNIKNGLYGCGFPLCLISLVQRYNELDYEELEQEPLPTKNEPLPKRVCHCTKAEKQGTGNGKVFIIEDE